jgi:uncharacterized protein (DUF433 family)
MTMASSTCYEHIQLTARRPPRIRGTRMAVHQLALEQQAYGWSPAELHFQHPELSLGQIHAALAYYHDHRPALDAEIAKRLAKVQQLAATASHTALRKRISARQQP